MRRRSLHLWVNSLSLSLSFSLSLSLSFSLSLSLSFSLSLSLSLSLSPSLSLSFPLSLFPSLSLSLSLCDSEWLFTISPLFLKILSFLETSLNCHEEQWASQITTEGKHFNHPDRLLVFGLYSSGGISAWLTEWAYVCSRACLCSIVVTFAACQCYGHTSECVFDEEVEKQQLSIDIHGNYEGGGVCQNCQVGWMFKKFFLPIN